MVFLVVGAQAVQLGRKEKIIGRRQLGIGVIPFHVFVLCRHAGAVAQAAADEGSQQQEYHLFLFLHKGIGIAHMNDEIACKSDQRDQQVGPDLGAQDKRNA